MSQDKLSSWKEIAAYLKRDESTVRRWERKNGLPIRRVGNKGGSVYAYPNEIDTWLSGQMLAEILPESSPTDETPDTSSDGTDVNPAAAESHTHRTAAVSDRSERHSTNHSRYVLPAAVLTIAGVMILAIALHQSTYSLKASAILLENANTHNASAAMDEAQEKLESELKQLIQKTQVWETLTLYAEPWKCDAHDLEQYWETGSRAFADVVESVSRLNERGWHYGHGARLLNFEFRYIRISKDRLSAEIGTIEHWWLPLYTANETVVAFRNPDKGPYEIDYLLIKAKGRWYLRSTTTPYPQWKPKQISCKNWPL